MSLQGLVIPVKGGLEVRLSEDYKPMVCKGDTCIVVELESLQELVDAMVVANAASQQEKRKGGK